MRFRAGKWRHSSSGRSSAATHRRVPRAGAFSVLLVVIISISLPAAGHPDDEYEFGGSGWGHSIGLSQYGAYGQALEGRTAEEILKYYYVGVDVDTISGLVSDGQIAADHPIVTDATPLWVGMLQNATSMTFTPVGGDVRFCQSVADAGLCADIGESDAGVPETWMFGTEEVDGTSGCRLSRVDPAPADGDEGPLGFGSCRASIIWDEGSLADRVGVDGAACAGTSGFGATCFNRGTLRVRDDAVDGGFHVALEIGLEEYLYGLGEMPSSWSSAALQAQAIAGRTYGAYRLLANEQPSLASENDAGLSDSRKGACWCHIYSTVRDQSYVAYAKEGQPGSSGGARWVSAVDATAGQVVTHPTATSVQSTIVLAFYHSSSGGITETNTAVWGTSPQPYLQSVDDAWSNSAAVSNPFESWTATFTAAQLAAVVGWDEVSSVKLANGAPGASFTVTGRDGGASVTGNVTSAALYAALGTRSPHIDSVVLDAFYPFLDMEGTVHTDAIFRIWEEGITNGCGDDFYCPEAELTRAQMATFLARTLDLTPITDGSFTDVETTSVHAPNINAVAAAGISVGCNPQGTNFCPEDTVSRAQMASFLVRALELEPVSQGPFRDLAGAAGHQHNINALWTAGVTNGCTADGAQYCPTDPVTRAQMASFLVRAFLD